MEFSEVLSVAALLISAGTLGAALLRFRHERKMEDRKDARSILAEGALELGRMKGALRDALTVFKDPLEGHTSWPPDFPEQIAKLEAAADKLEAALVAVRIRFEKDARAVREMIAAAEGVFALVAKYVQARQHDVFGGGRNERTKEKDFELIWQTSLDFDARRAGYLEAAQKAVGVKLG